MARTEAPGLQWRKRKTGKRIPYWYARPDLIKQGYRPKAVRLHYETDTPMGMEALASRCQRLQAEMLAWSGRGQVASSPIYDGKLGTLVKMYQTDEESSYRDVEPDTQVTYSKVLRLLLAKIGDPHVDEITGADAKRWFRNICASNSVGYAAYIISVFKSVVSFGASIGIDDCAKLRGQLTATRFKSGAARKERLTYAQVVAFREAAHRLKRPSAALWVTLQHELSLRRRDVIGKWIRDQSGTDGIRIGRRVWRDGLTWANIDAKGVLRRMVSKTAKTSAREAAHRLADYPDLMVEIDRIPAERRVGPIVINETNGLPYTPEQCRHYFRVIARAAGIPDKIWNMDARADAVTEAYEAGATTEGAMALASHSQVSTSRRYMRDTLEQSSRVARLRVQARQRTDGEQ